MDPFGTPDLYQKLFDNGYCVFKFYPSIEWFDPKLPSYVTDAKGGVICSFDPKTLLWSFCEASKCPFETNNMPMREKTPTEREVALLCLNHQLGIQIFSPNLENDQ